MVDQNDRAIELYGLYLIEQKVGPRLWQITPWNGGRVVFEDGRDEPTYMLSPMKKQDISRAIGNLNRPDTSTVETPSGPMPFLDIHLSDGPIGETHLQERIIGRVFGVYASSMEEIAVQA